MKPRPLIAILLMFACMASAPAVPLRLVHTRHYDIHTDMDPMLVTDLARRMDVMFDHYATTFADFKPPTHAPPLPVYLFQTHGRYMQFTGYSAINTGGIFHSGWHSYLAAYVDGQGRDALRRTLQHEAFHQFAYSTISRELPPWMNEGMAQTFEEAIWTGEDFLPSQVPPLRVRQLRVDMLQHRLVDFDKFMAITPRQWTTTLHSDVDKATTWYNQAWAMAYFCSGAGDPVYHTDFVHLLQELHEDKSLDQATKQCFPDPRDFRRKFNAWAATLKPTGPATIVERMDTLGDFLIAVSRARDIPKNMTDFRGIVVSNHLRIQYTRGQLNYSSADQPIEYFSDLNNRAYAPGELFFKTDNDAPLPDIICRPTDGEYEYRTHFYDGAKADDVEHETIITRDQQGSEQQDVGH